MWKALIATYFLAIGAALAKPVFDPDFWWRLASGRWIWERREWMQADPFAFTSAIFVPGGGEMFHFRQSWIAELLLYAVHAWAGLRGVVVLRVAVLTLMFFLLYLTLRRLGVGMLAAVLLIALANRAIADELGSVGDRPQIWSSLLFVATILLCQLQREGRRWTLFGVPLLMLLWSNLHGGYLLGLAVVGLSAGAAVLAGRASRQLIASTVASFALSGCNPGGFSVLWTYVTFRASGSGIYSRVAEELPFLQWVDLHSVPRHFPALAMILTLSLLTLLPRLKAAARARPDLLALYALTLAMGMSAIRFMSFFAVVATVLTAFNTAALLRERPAWGRRLASRDWFPAVRAAATALILVALTAQQAFAAARTSMLRPGTEYHHPYEQAANLLERSGLQGNIFNEYGIGGYLSWRLFPSLKVFIYGRIMSSDLFDLYEALLLDPSAKEGGRPRYRKWFDDHGVDALVFPSTNTASGLIFPLALVVVLDPDWALVHGDATALVFVRKSKAPAGMLASAPPLTTFYDNIIALAEQTRLTHLDRDLPAWRYSLAFALYAKGEREAALSVLDDYLTLAPSHEAAVRIRERIVREIVAATSPPAKTSGTDVEAWR